MDMQNLQHPSRKPRPALRLVGTKHLPREEWLVVRKQGIGSSDAAAAVGLNPYKSQLELWLEKTGRDTSLPKLDPQDEDSPAYWGNILEPIVAAHYSRRSGHRVRRLKQALQQAMGEASRAEFAEGYISWKKSKDSIGLDVEQMLKDKPYLQARYPKIKTGSRRFLIG